MNALNGGWSEIQISNHNPRRTTKPDKDFYKNLDFENIKFPLKIRDIHKIEKNRNISALEFLVMTNKEL